MRIRALQARFTVLLTVIVKSSWHRVWILSLALIGLGCNDVGPGLASFGLNSSSGVRFSKLPKNFVILS